VTFANVGYPTIKLVEHFMKMEEDISKQLKIDCMKLREKVVKTNESKLLSKNGWKKWSKKL